MRRLAFFLFLALLLAGSPQGSFGQEVTPALAGMDVLLDITVDRADLPGDEGFLLVGRNVLPPGARQTIVNPDEKGVIAIVVEAGALTYEIEGPGRIVRRANTRDAAEEPAPSGTAFTLEAGDALVYPAQRRIESNTSDEPLSFIFAVVLEPVPPPPPDPSDVGEVEMTLLGRFDAPWPVIPDGPVALTLERTRVAPGEPLATAPGSMQAVSQESGPPGALLIGGDGSTFNLGNDAADALVLTVDPLAPDVAAAAATREEAVASDENIPYTVEEITTVRLLAEAMPTDDASFDAWLSFWEPGESLEFPSYGSDLSIAADVVLTGEEVAQSAGRAQLQREGEIEEVTPGTEVSLGPNDAIVYVENSAAQKVRFPGENPSQTISFGVFEGTSAITTADWERSGMAEGDVAVVVERITIPPGGSLDAIEPSLERPRVYAVTAGELALSVIANDSAEPLVTLRFLPGQVIPFRTLEDGMRFMMTNAAAEPLTVIQLKLVAA